MYVNMRKMKQLLKNIAMK